MKKKIFYLLASAMVLLLNASCSDKTNFLYGDVMDKVTEEFIADCQVCLKDAQGKTLAVQNTGADGRWGFEVEVGVYTLTFAKDGYNSLEEDEVVVEEDKTLVRCLVRLSREGESEIELEWIEGAAPSFEGGSGSEDDPYLIKTGRQLLLIEDYASKPTYNYGDDESCTPFFKLVGDIDLRNKNWKPLGKFYGTLDGGGHTIKNLRIEYKEESDKDAGRGLFEGNHGIIKNLNVHGVTIIGDNAGAIVGYNNGVIDNCTVTSAGEDFSIKGNTIGGIAGRSSYILSNCRVSCNLNGENNVGGIVGYLTSGLLACEYQGKILGTQYVGGLCGYLRYTSNDRAIVACKADVDITAEDCISGLAGYVDGQYYKIIACYSTGRITCENLSAPVISGLANAGWTAPTCEGCYTTIDRPLVAFGDTRTKINFCYSVYDGSIYIDIDDRTTSYVDVARELKESYAGEVTAHWNLDNCWTWTGKVSNEDKEVRLPRLAWEK